ncbi:MAG: hypothetical protein VKP70_03770 [Cyanobacteriota bacterium]|nr:hypothetical protein [Cyanobacteriota bacterium]
MEPPSLPPAPLLQVERAVAPIAFPDPALETALHGVLFPPGSSPGACQHLGGVRYVFNRFDLDGDRQPETLVALLGQQRCSPAGCPLVLLKGDGERLVPLQTIVGLRTALVVSERSSHGWRDLILPAPAGEGGGPSLRLIHDGDRYPLAVGSAASAILEAPTRGIAALALKASPYLVQGHPLPCPSGTGEGRGRS